jgi:beta-lactam-binding protein with PASTA domain
MTPGRFGLIIASYRYADSGLRRLVAPARDAEALAAVLSDPRIGGFEVETVINRPSHEVARRIEGFFADRHRDDLLLLYFSGHGLKDSRGRLFLAMSNTERRMLNATAIPAGFVREALEQSRSRQNVLLLDCCYSGAFAKGMTPKADTSSVHTQDRFAAAGSVVLTASDSLQYSFEDDGVSGSGVESVFTRVLVEGLRSGAADRSLDGDVDLDELYDYIYDRVAKERPEQKPGKWAWDIHGRIIIARNPHWAMPTRIQQALDSPFPGMRLGAVEELVHLTRVGNDDVVARACQALEQLASDDSKKVCEAATAALEQVRAEAEDAQRIGGKVEERIGGKVEERVGPEKRAGERVGPEERIGPEKRAKPVPPPPAPASKPTAGEERRTSRMRHVVTPSRRSARGSARAAVSGVLRALVRKPRMRSAVLAFLATAALVSAVVVGLLLSASGRDVIVPRVTGDGVTGAAMLRDVGFTVRTVEVPADVPQGQVIRTESGADTRVGRHSTVTLYVSAGPRVVVPAVSGAADAAARKLTAAGLKVRKVNEASTKVRSGSVTRTIPGAGAEVAPGSVVRLYVSSGNNAKIPDVAGRPKRDADALIRRAGFLVHHQSDYSDTVPAGAVIGTSPAPGMIVARGTTVEEDVSRGPYRSVPVPPLPQPTERRTPTPTPWPTPTTPPTTTLSPTTTPTTLPGLPGGG